MTLNVNSDSHKLDDAQLKSLLLEMPVGILVVDDKGIIEFANLRTSRIFKCSMQDLVGTPWSNLMMNHQPTTSESGRRNLTILTENEGRRLSGETFPIKLSIRPFDMERNKLIVTIEDLTKEREAERVKQEFIAMISHDLRTPLSAVQGKLFLLASQKFGPMPDEAVKQAQLSTEVLDRLVRLINQLLDLEKLSTSGFSLAKKSCLLDTIIANSLDSIQSSINVNIKVKQLCPPQSKIYCDEDRIVQVLVNLLSNAIKYSPPGSEIVLLAEATGKSVCLSVTDAGRGVPPEMQTKIFDRFAQVEAADSTKCGGVGLGLAICKQIVQQHGGQIGVISEPGQGSTFWFTLPF
jgi:PAS domain S-box-containing protein